MIAFDSLEGTRLRAMTLSRSALMSLWFTALNEGQESWGEWARQVADADHPQDAATAALRFLQAAGEGDARRARQLWAVLMSFPIDQTDSKIIRAARDVGRATLG